MIPICRNSLSFLRAFTLAGTGLAAALVLCQTALAQSAAGTAASAVNVEAQFVESCRLALERGVVQPGCQGTLNPDELAQLKADALRTNNPNLLTLVGDTYQRNGSSGAADLGQAYRWYLLAAVRGDPHAMQRLSDMYRSGQGAPNDNVKALGYARLAQKLAPLGTAQEQQATDAAVSLGKRMAAGERALADQFAIELERELRQPTASGTSQASTPPPVPKDTGPITSRLPGLGAANISPPPPDALPTQDAAPSARPTSTAPLNLPGSTGRANPSNP